jgi:hypothetical protein
MEELKENEEYLFSLLEKPYKFCLFGEYYVDVTNQLEIDKNQIYKQTDFLALFEKILFALIKNKKFEDFDVVADNLIKYDLADFFWDVMYRIIETNFCKV